MILEKNGDSASFLKVLNKLNANVVSGDDFKALEGKYIRLSPRTHEVNEKFIELLEQLEK
jgi:histidinol-phosphate/aromatic aminotransferase/cobyric acid decarboxylase-like protein